jgi:uncharacterized membrane protein YhaH (DUF805 family)
MTGSSNGKSNSHFLSSVTRIFDVKGRGTRSEFWGSIFIFYCIALAPLVTSIILGQDPNERMPPLIANFFFALIAFLWLNMVTAACRRFHDQDMSGWFCLLALIPSVGGLLLLIFGSKNGTEGPNKFGEDPLGRVGAIWDIP